MAIPVGRAKEYLYLALVYTAAWGLLLLNTDFIYWDDWILLNHDNATRDAFYRMVAAPQKGMMHNFLQQIGNGVFIYRVIIYLSYLVSAGCFLWVLRHLRGGEGRFVLLIAMLAAVYPANQARIALIDMPYGLTLATFSLATVLAMLGEHRATWLPRILALVLFAFSFFTKSFLVFYLVPMSLLLYVSRQQLLADGFARAPVRLAGWGVRHLDYLLLPILFFLLTNRYLVPNTLYAGYNTVSPAQLPGAALASVRSLLNLSWFPPVRWFGEPPLRHGLVVTLLGLAALGLGAGLYRQWRERTWLPGWWLVLLLGGLLLFLAILPYQVVDKIPAFHDWLSRHQLLYPMGAAVVLVALVRLAMPARPACRVAALMIGGSILVSNNDLLWYYADGVRQQGLVAALAEQDVIRYASNQVVLFDDRAQDTNAMARFYRYYEYSAFMRRAFGDASRFGERRSHWHEWTLEKILESARWRHFNYGDFAATRLSVAGTVIIERGDYRPESLPRRLGLFLTGLTDRDALADRARQMVSLRWQPAD